MRVFPQALLFLTLLLTLVCLMPLEALAHKDITSAEARELIASPPPTA